MKVLLACLMFSLTHAFAQTAQQPRIGFGFGWSYVAVKAPTTSDFTYKSSGVPLQLFFDNDGAKNRHSVQLFYQTARLTDAVANYLDEIRGGFQYAYHRRISVMENGLTIYGGGILNGQASIRQGTGTNSKDGNVFLGLDASVLAIYHTERNTFEGQFSTTLLAYTVSAEYGLSPPPGADDAHFQGESDASLALKYGKWGSFGNFYQFNARLSYERSLSKRFSARADYRWNYYRFRYDPVFGSLSNQLIASLVYKFNP